MDHQKLETFTIASNPPRNQWVKKMQSIYPMEYYSTTKKNDILSLAAKWMDVEDTILREINRQRKTYTARSLSYVKAKIKLI